MVFWVTSKKTFGLLASWNSHNNIPWRVHVHNYYLKSCLWQVIHIQSAQHFIFFFWWRPTHVLSPVNVRNFRDFLSGRICDSIFTSGKLTWASFTFLHDGLAFSGVASIYFVLFIGVPLIVGKAVAFTSLNKWPRLTILRPKGLHAWSEKTSGSCNKTNPTWQ